MLKDCDAFSGYSVDDLDAARHFYGEILGLRLEDNPAGVAITLASGGRVFLYPKPDHEPAGFTVLNFRVGDIEATVDALAARGVAMARYDGFDQDARGIGAPGGGPRIAWFTDPAGNVLSVLQG